MNTDIELIPAVAAMIETFEQARFQQTQFADLKGNKLPLSDYIDELGNQQPKKGVKDQLPPDFSYAYEFGKEPEEDECRPD